MPGKETDPKKVAANRAKENAKTLALLQRHAARKQDRIAAGKARMIKGGKK